MRQSKKTTAPLGVAFLFMSLVIVPVSLKAMGVNFSFRPSAVVDAFKEISAVVASAYNPPLFDLLTSGGEVEQPTCQRECPLLLAATQTPALELKEPVAAVTPDCPKRDRHPDNTQASRGRAIAGAPEFRVELPVQARALAEVFRWKSSLATLPADLPQITIDVSELSRVRFERRELIKRFGTRDKTDKMDLLLRYGQVAPRSKETKSTCRASVKPTGRTA